VGYGCANIERGIVVDPRRTVFHVASVSKPSVALAAVQLATDPAVVRHRRAAHGGGRGFVGLSMWFGFGFIAVTNRAAERGGGEIVYGMPPLTMLVRWGYFPELG